MSNLNSTAMLCSAVETLVTDSLVLLDQVDSDCHDGAPQVSDGLVGLEAATVAAGPALSLWLSRFIEELMRCLAQAQTSPGGSDLATRFAADRGEVAQTPLARALDQATFELFARWDRLQGDWTLDPAASSPARNLQLYLIARFAMGNEPLAA